MPETRIQTRISEDLATWLHDRDQRMHTGTVHLQARTELGMWRGALAAELRRIRLTLEQANFLASILNGTTLGAALGPTVFYEAADAFEISRTSPLADTEYPGENGIDEEALLAYLRGLGPTADHALADAISRWWDTKAETTIEGWASVGLTVTP